ncbi:hypothetical protein AY601_0990 [Pedobacter cryoconitis]|uniref:Uncharacterized protein n=1 Tax=Pedobacter cryoconitis TaxID=188932 RepID=A0A127V9I2_9SPHI|nr:hypothetical protein [Pedobacter cryoconitis]AMP97925.1 hypothetical protein AY601_0990 [Pedobacter cryoconitis]
MIKISCPYDWVCGQEFTIDELSAHDQDFVISAAAKKMKLIFIDCPVCKVTFSYNPSSNVSTASEMINPDQKDKKGPVRKTLKEFNALLKKDKIVLLPAYLAYLKSAKFKAQLKVFKDQDAFELLSYDSMREVVNIDGRDYVNARQLKGFALSLSELEPENNRSQETGVSSAYGKDNYFFTLDELADSIVIGQSGTRLLFIDSRDQDTLFVFHPDGGDIEKTSLSLRNLMNLLNN